jgi:uncharacterized protein (DUF302 family)
MTYYFAKTLNLPFEDAVMKTREALAQEGFGVISEIDVQKTLKTKLGVEFRPYLILGACNPTLAYEALKLEDKVGVMLPCNVIIQDAGAGRSEVAAIDPVASMIAIGNSALTREAESVGAKLKSVIGRL